MVDLTEVANLAHGPSAFMVGLGSPITAQSGNRIYVTSASGGGIMALDPDSLGISDHRGFGLNQSGLGSARFIAQIDGSTLVAAGQRSSGLEIYKIDGNGMITGHYQITANGFPSSIQSFLPVTLGGKSYFLITSPLSSQIEVWHFNGVNALSKTGQAAGFGLSRGEIVDTASLTIGGKTFVYALSGPGNALLTYEMGANGALNFVTRLGQEHGLAIYNPSEIEVLTTAKGTSYLFLASSGTSSLVVAEALPSGQLRMTDHVMDDIYTRFSNISAITALQVEQHAYVAVAGSDDGVSLFTLLPSGKLVLVDTIADSATASLHHISGLSSRWNGREIEIYATGLNDKGVSGSGATKLTYNLGNTPLMIEMGTASTYIGRANSEIIIAGELHSLLNGAGGDDILVDGPGSDTMIGGGGADIYVLTPDRHDDYIMDFNPNLDRIDISQIGAYYTMDSLNFRSLPTGGELSFAGQKVFITSHNSKRINLAQLQIEDLRGPTHIQIYSPEGSDDYIKGTRYGDILQGYDGNDTLIGRGGPDQLIGGNGDDLLDAGGIDQAYDIAAGQIYRLYKSALGREPDFAGHEAWTGAIYHGHQDLLTAANGFIQSAEFKATYNVPHHGDFVNLLYQNVLGRSPDAGGHHAWTTALLTGAQNRAMVLTGFSESAELIQKTQGPALTYSFEAAQMRGAADIYRLYQGTLNRAPDAEGLLNWAAYLARGASLKQAADGFIQSQEFLATYGQSNSQQFVSLLYNNVLKRAPDAEGLHHWTAHLNSVGRNEVVADFLRSSEFVQQSKTGMEHWMRAQGIDDVLMGGSGNNILFGGMMSDQFVFNASEPSNDVVYGFETWDVLQFSGFGYHQASDVHHRLSQSATGTYFHDQGSSILFAGTAIHEVMAASYLF